MLKLSLSPTTTWENWNTSLIFFVDRHESASASLLAIFSSLLIEFVDGHQNLVNSLEELSVKVKFEDPGDLIDTKPVVGFWIRLFKAQNQMLQGSKV